jgi:hypothetical protein
VALKAKLSQPFPMRILASLLFLFLSLTSWALSSPIGSNPDDDYHLPSIWCAETPINDSCNQNENGYEVPRQLLLMGCFARNPNVTGDCTNRSTDVNEVIPFKHLNNVEKAYPVGFYNLMSILKNNNLMLFVFNVRILNSLIFIFGLALLLLLLKNIDIWIRVIMIQIISMIPLGFFTIASTNPSSWPMSFLTGFWIAMYTIGKERKKPFGAFNLFVVVFFWLGLNFARSDGSIFSIVVLSSLLIIFYREREVMNRSYALLIFALTILSFINFLSSKTPKSVILGEAGLSERLSGFDLFWNNLGNLGFYFLGGAGRTGLGWFDTFVDPFVWRTLSFLMVFILIASLISVLQDRNYRSFGGTLFLLLTYLLIPIISLQINGWKVGEWIQPRYLLPMVPLVILSSFLDSKISTRRVSLYFLFISPMLLLSYVLSLGANIQRYSSGTNVPWSISSYSNFGWSMFGLAPINIFVVGSTFFALFLATIVLYYREVYGYKGENVSAI